ncbi:hypothetical protein [Pontibacillus salipaludis]|uniref:hypothetical protein n=1 Tax=Pontibacillus salipaludis TaxID=1697394 RepID=UPI0031ED5E93
MNSSKLILSLIIMFVLLVGCNDGTTVHLSTKSNNPTPKDYLESDTDIFLLSGYVFSNAQDVDWVKELEYELGEQIGEITKQSEQASQFTNGTANKLPVGTKVFKTDTQAYIAIVEDEEILYLKMVEG